MYMCRRFIARFMRRGCVVEGHLRRSEIGFVNGFSCVSSPAYMQYTDNSMYVYWRCYISPVRLFVRSAEQPRHGWRCSPATTEQRRRPLQYWRCDAVDGWGGDRQLGRRSAAAVQRWCRSTRLAAAASNVRCRRWRWRTSDDKPCDWTLWYGHVQSVTGCQVSIDSPSSQGCQLTECHSRVIIPFHLPLFPISLPYSFFSFRLCFPIAKPGLYELPLWCGAYEAEVQEFVVFLSGKMHLNRWWLKAGGWSGEQIKTTGAGTVTPWSQRHQKNSGVGYVYLKPPNVIILTLSDLCWTVSICVRHLELFSAITTLRLVSHATYRTI